VSVSVGSFVSNVVLRSLVRPPEYPYGEGMTTLSLDELLAPPTPIAERALDVARSLASPALLNHSLRSHAFAAALGHAEGIAFDPELLYVASMLHDIGLVPVFDSVSAPFEEAGGRVAWVFGAGAGWAPERRERASEVIVRHMWSEVDPNLDAEGHLLERATSIDVSGSGWDDWPAQLREDLVARVPRLGFAAEFTECIREQARRKPGTQAERAVIGGLPERAAHNRLDG
jgi:hypothetical protein